MILREAYNQSIDEEIQYYEQRIRECEKYGDVIGMENWLDLVRFTQGKKVNEKEGGAA